MTTETDTELEQARTAVLERKRCVDPTCPICNRRAAKDEAALRRFERAVRMAERKGCLNETAGGQQCPDRFGRHYAAVVTRWCANCYRRDIISRELEGQP